MAQLRRSFLTVLVTCLAALALTLAVAAQTLTTGGVNGQVLDPSGAAIPGATIRATNMATGAVRTAISDHTGAFTLSQLVPANYTLVASAKGFEKQMVIVAVGVSTVARAIFKLPVGSESQTVEVDANTPIISTSNPNTTTTVSATQISLQPNPGGDLTYEAQVAPGAVMNTTGGYGNAEFNGLPATSVNYTIDGMDANDPFLNLNNSGATNMLLGLNAVQQASINTLSYSVDQGRQDGAQVNYVTKSGTNGTHGDLYEIWNDSYMNANDFFNNASPGGAVARPNGHVSNFGGDIGGPLIHNKLFYFLDVEAERIALPTVQDVTSPSPAFQQTVLNTLAAGGTTTDPDDGTAITANPASVPFYQHMFSLYPSGGTPTPIYGCPIGSAASVATGNGNGCGNFLSYGQTNSTDQTYVLYRMDYDMSATDAVWFKYDQNLGTQATYTDPVNSVFDADSYQPERDGEAEWQHIFGPNVINVLNTGFTWYSAIFQQSDPSAALAAFPYELGNAIAGRQWFTEVGGAQSAWPQGRNVTQWQVIDNLSWMDGNHDFTFGENLKRVDVSDHDFGFNTAPYVGLDNITEYDYGAIGYSQQAFPVTEDEPIALTDLDMYAGDTWRVTPSFTFDYGIRATWNEDPVNQQALFSYPSTSFMQMSHSVTQPLDEALQDGQSEMLPSTPFLVWQPRVGFSWQLAPKTVLRGGFGLFSDIFPASLADAMGENLPYYSEFLLGTLEGGAYQLAPGLGNGQSFYDTGVADNRAVVNGFSSGALSCAAYSGAAPANCIPVAGLTALPTTEMKYPYAMEYSFGIERQFGNTWGVTAQWVGTQSRQSPYYEEANGYQTACTGCLAPWPSAPPDARFSGVTQYETGANSDYNGLQVTVKKTMGAGFTLDGNYTWSHCLDTISNGSGFATFGGTNNTQDVIPGELSDYYGDCDYDVRNNFSGSYVWMLPVHNHQGVLGDLIDGWNVSGTLFIHSGLPVTVESPGNPNLVDAGGLQFANQVAGVSPYAESQNLASTPPDTYQWVNPAAFSNGCPTNSATGVPLNATTAGCSFGDVGRNTLRGPGFFWSDFFLTKQFHLTEKYKLRIDGQFYNVFNHPNLNQPASGGFNEGYITSMANPPTGLLGSGLGGDTAVRMIALQGKITF
ncbi:MAG: carboxypeptidase regulatory-like domain-containing protein [Terriglobales bacterium]